MRVQLSYAFVAVVLGSSACLLAACTTSEGSDVGAPPHSAGVASDDGPAPGNGNGEGANASPPLATADDIRSTTPDNDDIGDGGAGDDRSADDPAAPADAGGNDGQCNTLALQPDAAPYYAQFAAYHPDFATYYGGEIQDGTYVLTEARRALAQPPGPDGGGWTDTRRTTLHVKGDLLTAVVASSGGAEERFNAVIVRNGKQFYLKPLCGLDSTEWRELRFPYIRSAYTATNDTFNVAWDIGNHAGISMDFRRLPDPDPTPNPTL